MSTSPTITEPSDEANSRGELAYVCARNQWQAHSLLLRAVRDSGLSQKELAKRTGIDEATISRVLARPRNLELNTLSKLLFGACNSYLIFSLFQPHAATHKVHLAQVTSESSDRVFLLRTSVHLAMEKIATSTTSTSPVRSRGSSSDARIVEKEYA